MPQGKLEQEMKRKPDILVVLAALLGFGMILSSFSGPSIAEPSKTQTQVTSAR